MSEQKTSWLIPSALLAAGLIIAALVLGLHFKDLRQSGEITVKGVAEEKYQADNAEWAVKIAVWNANYGGAVKSVENLTPDVINFLKSQGFSDNEISIGSTTVDAYMEDVRNEQGNYMGQRQNGWNAARSIGLRSKDLGKIQKAYAEILNFKAQNNYIRFSAPSYLIDDLENIKRSLIAKATEDAKMRAQEFAKSGGGTVGAMKSASQGSFNIYSDEAGDSEESSEDYGGVYDKSTINKRVRLVVTVKYGIQ